MEWTDHEATEHARAGDQGAFRLLVERHSHVIFRLAFRMSGNEQDAEDVVQETFLRAYKQLHRFDGRSAFGTWIYRICVNCSLDLIRARKLRREQQPPEQPSTALNDDHMSHWLEKVAARDPSPERLSQSQQIAALLRPALDRLSETERSAFLLRHYEGCDIEQIAEVLGVRAGAAKHSVFRAVQKLRRALQPLRERRTSQALPEQPLPEVETL
jgi:RNA polymerase sigma-70 factor (ECF subfamily)